MRKLTHLAGLVAGTALTAAALAAPAQAQTLTFMGWVGLFEFQKPGWDRIVSEFEAANPGVKIDYIGTPFEDTLNQATIAIVGNNAPDLIQVSASWIAQLNGINGLADLKPLMDPASLAQFPETPVNAVTYDGRVLALPWLPGPIAMGYNRNLMTKAGLDPNNPPKSWEEFKAAVTAICEVGKAEGIYGVALRTARHPNSAHWSIPVIWANGGSVQTEDGTISFNNPGARAAFEWYRDTINSGCAPDAADIQVTRNLFATGKAGFIFEGPWLMGLIDSISQGALKVAADGDIWIAPMPAAADGVVRQIDNSNMVSISAQSKQPELAAKFVDFLLGNAPTVEFFFEGSKQPTTGRLDILTQGAFAADAYTQAFVAAIADSNPVPIKHAQATAMLDAVSLAMQAIVRGADAEAELQQADTAIAQIVEDN